MSALRGETAGQVRTIRRIRSSGSRRMSRTASSPPVRRNASICSATVADTPGIVRQRRSPSASPSISAAWTRNSTAVRGEANQCRMSSGTGRTASRPFSGSRMMLEKNEDAARFGLPGRTQIVGSRMPTPSMKPRLV
jgi:hypothetical protein